MNFHFDNDYLLRITGKELCMKTELKMMLKKEDAVLVVVDVQGKLATLMYEKEDFFSNVIRMIKGAKVLNVPIIWNEQLPDKLGKTIPEIAKHLEGKQPLVKKSFSCCGNVDFVQTLASYNRKQVLLVGMETHICVYQTARDLLDSGYEVYVVTDAVASRKWENKQVGLSMMKDMGAKYTSVEMALFDMFETTEGDQFREIVQIVK